MSEIRDDIKGFIRALRNMYDKPIPQFCHNMNTPDNKVYYAGPYFDDNETAAAIETLLFGKWSSGGEVTAKFEKEFGDKFNQNFACFVNSGSSANLVLFAACKEFFQWQDNDEIIVSSVGFPTSVSTIVQNNLKPVFIDIEWLTLNFDVDKIQEAITPKTKAIFVSPVLGNPPDMDKIVEICDKNNLKLLLDCCDSLGSKWNDQYLSEYAIMSSFSFYPAHEITSLEGGMVTSNIPELVRLARSYATWGRDCWCVGTNNLLPNGTCCNRFSNWLKNAPDTIVDHRYVFDRMGYNLKPLDLQAAIGLEQLKKVDEICKIRKDNFDKITSIFQIYAPIQTICSYMKAEWVPFGVPFVCVNKEAKQKLVKYLEQNGIQTRNYFAGNLLLHKGFSHLGDYKEFKNANWVLDIVFFVGCAPTISNGNIIHIENVMKGYKI